MTADAAPKRFGTFSGVFTPSILTILGVVMYMRMGWVTGHAGLAFALGIVVVSHLISLATGLSVASIATNRTVGAGGAYFMISRALGAPAGAAIGFPLFLAQGLSVTFYVVGFAEAVQVLVPWVHPALLGTVVNVLLTAISIKSADLALKTQYVVMLMIIASLVAFFTGQSEGFPHAIEWVNPESDQSLASIFAAFFPAVTGIMAGVSMSGDLKDPRKSIPRGTLAAILVGFVVYMSFPVWLAVNFDNATLTNDADDFEPVFGLATVPALIYVGVWGATLSSALGSILTAPRTLQALAKDGLAPRIFARGLGKSQEPVFGLVLTFALSQTGVLLGSLDAIAPVLTMFFLATYGVTNLACGLEKWAASPSFRPRFRVPAPISLGGALACFYVMSVINLLAMVVALILCALIYLIAQRRALGTTYGDARHGMWAALVRSALQRLRRVEFHPLNWRPNLVVFGGNPEKRTYLLRLGNAIVQDRGIITYFHLLRGRITDLSETRRSLFDAFEPSIAERFPNVFYRVDITEDIYRGASQVAQSYGIGSFEANTVMLGWPRKPERSQAYVDMLLDLVSLDKSLLLVRYDAEKGLGQNRVIHVWWGGLRGNGGLMLLLAFLITAHHRWRNAKVKVLTVVGAASEQQRTASVLEKTLLEARIDAEPRVIVREDRSIPEIMRVESRDADLAIVGFALPARGSEHPLGAAAIASGFFERMNAILQGLPTTLLVHSARGFESDPVLFDERPPSAPPSSRPPADSPRPDADPDPEATADVVTTDPGLG